MRPEYRSDPMPAAEARQPGGCKPRAHKRPKGAPTHVRSWPLRVSPAQRRDIRTRFFTGVRVYNAVLGEFIARSRAAKADPAWQVARDLPRRGKRERAARGAAFDAVAAAHGFTADAAQSFASGLRRSWVREYLRAQETQNVGARAFDAVRQWHLGRKGEPRFKSPKRGLHSLAAKDGHGALRPKTDAAGTHKWAHCGWRRSDAAARTGVRVAVLHRRLAEHRKTLHGTLANRLLGHGAMVACERLDYVSWQKRRGRRNPPSRRSVARINARHNAKAVMRQSRSLQTSTTDQPTAIAA